MKGAPAFSYSLQSGRIMGSCRENFSNAEAGQRKHLSLDTEGDKRILENGMSAETSALIKGGFN